MWYLEGPRDQEGDTSGLQGKRIMSKWGHVPLIFVILPNETADKLSWLKYLQKELMGNLLMKQVSS